MRRHLVESGYCRDVREVFKRYLVDGKPGYVPHEWAHLAGHAPESEASFVAFLACLQGPRDIQYSGWLDLLLQLILVDGVAQLSR